MALLAKYSLKVATSSILLPMLLKHEPDSRLTSACSFLSTRNNIAQLTQFLQTGHRHLSLVPYLYSYDYSHLSKALALFCCFCLECLYLMTAKSKQSSRYLKAYPLQRNTSTNDAGRNGYPHAEE